MAATQKPTHNFLFPTRDNLEQVMKEGLAQLPITTPNQLVFLLQVHQNTLLKLVEI